MKLENCAVAQKLHQSPQIEFPLKDGNHKPLEKADKIVGVHPIISNILIIVLVAVLGIVIAYLSLSLFTKHGQTDVVPKVTNITYSGAIEKLHAAGFKVEIRDSLYLDDVKPGYVVDQFPSSGSVVKPGRKVFLYINAVHPKEVILDPTGNAAQPALRGFSMRQAKAQLEELGFRNVRIVYVLGDTDRVVKVLANGKQVMKQEKVPVNAQIMLEVYDGRLSQLVDSLHNADLQKELEMQQAAASYEPLPDVPQEEETPATEPEDEGENLE